MYCRKTYLSIDEQNTLDGDINQFQFQILGEIPTILEHIPSNELRQQVYNIAFKANGVLPKRQSRPQMVAAYLVDQLFAAYSAITPMHAPSIRFTVSAQEYYDMLDDVVDGDVSAANIPQVILISQTLMPVMLKELNQLGKQAIDYWSERTLSLLNAIYLEKCNAQNRENFLRALDAQSWLYGACTGLVAFAIERPEIITIAEEIGRSAYRYSKLFLDFDQNREELREQWNSAYFFSTNELRNLMETEYSALCNALEQLPDPEIAAKIRALFSVDIKTDI